MAVVLATAGYDHMIRFWEAPSGVCIRMIKFADSQVNRIEISPDKQFIAACGNPVIRVFEIENPQQQLSLEGHTNNVTSLGFHKDGRYLYTSSEDRTIKVWDLRSPKYSHSWDVGAPVNSVCLRSDRDEFISGDQDGFVKIWDLSSSKCLHSVQPTDKMFHDDDEDDPESIASTKSTALDGAAVAAALQRKRRGRFAQSETVKIQSVDISEDSRTLVAASNHATIFVWDPSNMNELLRPITRFRAHGDGSYCLQAKIAPDCRHLVTTSSDNTAKLWDTATWELTQTLSHEKWVWDATYSADSSYLVTSSSDNIARLWNLRTAEVVREYYGHQSAVTCVALNDFSDEECT